MTDSDEALNALADIKQNQNKQFTQKVENTIYKELDKRGLSEILSNSQIQMINNKLVSVANFNVLTSNPKAFKQNTKDVLKRRAQFYYLVISLV